MAGDALYLQARLARQRSALSAVSKEHSPMTETIELPPPDERGGLPLSQVLMQRRSLREFAPLALEWKQIGQLLWAAQGVSDRRAGLRTAPSAGALYPLEVDAVLPSGVYRYRSASHTLLQRSPEDARAALARAAFLVLL